MMLHNYDLVEERIKKLQRDSGQAMLLTVVFSGLWIYLNLQYRWNVSLFYDGFLYNYNLGSFITCLGIIMIFMYIRRKIRYFRFFKIITSMLGILTVIDLAMMITVISTQENPFSDNNEMNYATLALMLITVCNLWITSHSEYKIIVIMIEIALTANEMLRNLIEQYNVAQHNQALDEENAQRRVERINSVDPHQLNNVYGNQCTICDEECGIDSKAVQLKCQHIFHGECIRKWLLQKNFCPNCRDVVSHEN